MFTSKPAFSGEMTPEIAKYINRTMESAGVPLQVEFISPKKAEVILKENSNLLSPFGLSQMMLGDADNQVRDKKGRLLVDTLAQRMESDWKWYISTLLRLSNGGVLNGISRILACIEAGKNNLSFEGFWTLIYNAAEPDDMKYVDDLLSGRTLGDDFVNKQVLPYAARIAEVIVPKYVLLENSPETDPQTSYALVPRDDCHTVFNKYSTEFKAAAQFVKKAKGSPAVTRKALVALMYMWYVGRPEATNKESALKLLTAYKTGMAQTSAEARLVRLASLFMAGGKLLHARNECQPAFHKVMNTLLMGKDVRLELADAPTTNGAPKKKILISVVGERKKNKN